mmetsp:Transcript_5482/g.11205  ORF Transcript_5482/g.11205 Transcript_5482/m.11205 type:complete len:229 (-) Transcript_5482:142-828(-)
MMYQYFRRIPGCFCSPCMGVPSGFVAFTPCMPGGGGVFGGWMEICCAGVGNRWATAELNATVEGSELGLLHSRLAEKTPAGARYSRLSTAPVESRRSLISSLKPDLTKSQIRSAASTYGELEFDADERSRTWYRPFVSISSRTDSRSCSVRVNFSSSRKSRCRVVVDVSTTTVPRELKPRPWVSECSSSKRVVSTCAAPPPPPPPATTSPSASISISNVSSCSSATDG